MKCPGSFGCFKSLPTSTVTSKNSPFLTFFGAVIMGRCFFSRSVACLGSSTIFTPQKMSSVHASIVCLVFVTISITPFVQFLCDYYLPLYFGKERKFL